VGTHFISATLRKDMAFLSITRLRVRSWVYVPPFVWQSIQSARQAECAPGFLGGCLLREAKNIFWTMTAWQDSDAMNSYRTAGFHRRVMPKLLDWCDEASVVHWNQENADLPCWIEAHRRMVSEGRLSKVRHPSPSQIQNRIPVPKPGRIQRALKPSRAKHS
jgi:hypothetical protein